MYLDTSISIVNGSFGRVEALIFGVAVIIKVFLICILTFIMGLLTSRGRISTSIIDPLTGSGRVLAFIIDVLLAWRRVFEALCNGPPHVLFFPEFDIIPLLRLHQTHAKSLAEGGIVVAIPSSFDYGLRCPRTSTASASSRCSSSSRHSNKLTTFFLESEEYNKKKGSWKFSRIIFVSES